MKDNTLILQILLYYTVLGVCDKQINSNNNKNTNNSKYLNTQNVIKFIYEQQQQLT